MAFTFNNNTPEFVTWEYNTFLVKKIKYNNDEVWSYVEPNDYSELTIVTTSVNQVVSLKYSQSADYAVIVDWDDGNAISSVIKEAASGNGYNTVSHTYATIGTYYIKLFCKSGLIWSPYGATGSTSSRFITPTSILTNCILNNRVQTIYTMSFYGCTSLVSITLPSSLTSIGNDAFAHCGRLINIYYNSIFENWCKISFGTAAANPISVNGATSSLYLNNVLLSGIVTIPNSITTINSYAFYNYQKITQLIIPNTVTTIEYGAFGGDPNKITAGPIGGNYDIEFGWTTDIPAKVFSYTLIEECIIPEGITTIRSQLFYYCQNLEKVTFPSTLNKIEGSQFFTNCSSLNTIISHATTPPSYYFDITGAPATKGSFAETLIASGWDNVTPTNITLYIPEQSINVYQQAGVWNLLSNIQAIIYPTIFEINRSSNSTITFNLELNAIDATEIIIDWGDGFTSSFITGQISYQHAYSMGQYTITVESNGAWQLITPPPNSLLTSFISGTYLTKIGPFQNYSILETVIIRYGCEVLGSFSGCTSLETIELADTIQSLNNSAFYNCTSLTNISIPFQITTIPQNAFAGCTSLEEIVLPDMLQSINDYAFDSCTSLEEIELTSLSLSSIVSTAFNNCSNLEKISLKATIPPTLSLPFTNFPSTCIIEVPGNALGSYQTTYAWSEYVSTNQLIGTAQATKLYITITSTAFKLYFTQSVTQGVKIDWGDGTTASRLSGTTGTVSHTYSATGSYIVTITENEGVTWSPGYGENGLLGAPGTKNNTFPALTSVEFGSAMRLSATYGFAGCTGLTSITIPAFITEIAANVFKGCANLSTIICHPITPPTIQSTTFTDVPSACSIKVPSGSVSVYKTASNWSSRSNYITAI